MSMLDQLEAIVTRMRRHGFEQLDIADGEERLTLTLSTAPHEAPRSSPETVPARTLERSPEMGKFRATGLEQRTAVTAGTVIGFVEVEDVRVAIVASIDGELGAPLVSDGAVIGYGDPVFEIMPREA